MTDLETTAAAVTVFLAGAGGLALAVKGIGMALENKQPDPAKAKFLPPGKGKQAAVRRQPKLWRNRASKWESLPTGVDGEVLPTQDPLSDALASSDYRASDPDRYYPGY